MLFRSLGVEQMVHKPQMPNSLNADYGAWRTWFDKVVEFCGPAVILVGHSLGGSFLLRYLSEEQCGFSVRQLHLVAAPVEEGEENLGCGEFAPSVENLFRISEKVSDVFVYHSRDDDVVPFWHGERLAEIGRAHV